MLAVHWAASAVYHMHAQHCMPPYSTHSTQPGVVLLCLLVVSSRIHCPFLKSHLVMCPFTRLLRFCSRTLFFFSFGGIFGKFWFCAFWFVFLFFFCKFLDFLHFREILVVCLSRFPYEIFLFNCPPGNIPLRVVLTPLMALHVGSKVFTSECEFPILALYQ